MNFSSYNNISKPTKLEFNPSAEEEENNFEQFEHIWKPVLVTSLSTLLLALWSVISFIKYAKTYRKWKNKKLKQTSANLMTSALVTSCITLPRICLTLVLIFIGHFTSESTDGGQLCFTLMKISSLFYYLATVSSFIHLWYRQKIIYQQPFLKHLNTVRIQMLSWIAIAVTTLGGLIINFFIMISYSHHMTEYGCESASRKDFFYSYLFLFFILVFSHLLVLGLFCYPIFIHINRKFADCNHNKKRLRQRNRYLLKTVHKTSLSIFICLLAEFVTLIITTVLSRQMPDIVFTIIYDIDLCANIISIMLSFHNRKYFILFCKKQNATNSDSFELRNKTTVSSLVDLSKTKC